MPAWADCTRLREYLDAYGTPMTDAELNVILDQSEGYHAALLKLEDGNAFTFDANKKTHQLLRHAVLLRAAMIVLASSPISYFRPQDVSTALDVYRVLYGDSVALLNDPGIAGIIIKTDGGGT